MSAQPQISGPVQMLVLELDRAAFDGRVLPELERLTAANTIRLVDLLFVRKPVGGELEVVPRGDAVGVAQSGYGAIVGALVGVGNGSDDAVAVDGPAAGDTDG